ncbi:carbohydrate ABC transporter permease [Oceanotoga sp. DSM 15011]|jgi:multiple sugar transport system permease protein|uniref:carbohydrate ABC transporter permease n=1 Tax=Oceanotoga sp. DSM 15011 TaxID=2984951 RepID=UPI0021F4503C|nr:carbohydrate ABC transporter permease [Oceanotoga sp. DSM 15011]UYO99257.1 carbohydrate ABC transporter permease [Oceanotoga sp. DSM 15011]
MNYKKNNFGEKLSDTLIWIFLIVFAIIIIAPIIFMFSASFMKSNQILRMPFSWIPEEFYFQNYQKAIAGNSGNYIYIRNILNSIIVSAVVTISTIFLSAIAGYGLAKFPFKGRNIVFICIMATMMIPFEAIMVPLYLVITKLNLQNTYMGLIVPFLTNAFGIFMMRQFLITFPDELLDAARIDGANEFKIFWKIVFPNSLPVIATLGILTFRAQWDNMLWPLLVIQSEEMKTIPLYIVKFTAEMNTDEGAMMAVAAIASIPMFILFFTLSKYFLSGANLHSSRK